MNKKALKNKRKTYLDVCTDNKVPEKVTETQRQQQRLRDNNRDTETTTETQRQQQRHRDNNKERES